MAYEDRADLFTRIQQDGWYDLHNARPARTELITNAYSSEMDIARFTTTLSRRNRRDEHEYFELLACVILHTVLFPSW
ncbi:MAG: hypothetical protein ABI988_16045, partial [Nitrospirota bacterium]